MCSSDLTFLLKFVWIYYAGMIVLLLLVLFAGDDAKGAQRWFEIAERLLLERYVIIYFSTCQLLDNGSGSRRTIVEKEIITVSLLAPSLTNISDAEK